MKKFIKVLALLVAPVTVACGVLSGCKSCKGKAVNIEIGTIMQHKDSDPARLVADNVNTKEPYAAYEQYTKASYAAYKQVAQNHVDEGGEILIDDPAVQTAARKAAAEMFAYACYNERHLDNYVFFSDMDATTDLGSTGKAVAKRQEYYLRVNEQEDTCGYRYHYSLKKVIKASGPVKTMKSQFETARLRFTDKTDLLYRFEGNDIKLGEFHEALDTELLYCNWRTGDDWGKSDAVMRKAETFVEPQDIAADIVQQAGNGDTAIRANINILCENIIKYAMIAEDEEGCINVFMTIDTDVANEDDASVKMLTRANGTSGDCHWKKGGADPGDEDNVGFGEDTGLKIAYRIWGNGLFRMYSISERWRGKIVAFTGTADSLSFYYYSYSQKDCDMTDHLAMLEAAKKKKG